ncbi:MAG: hypothetical protein U0797_17565 [Gemmataceae bacterium]
MTVPSSLRWLNGHAGNQHRKRARRHPFHPRLVTLEERTVPTVFTVSTLADSGNGSLRQAVLDANGHAGADTIRFTVSGTIALTTGQLGVTDALTVQGPGAGRLAVSGSDASRVFHIAGGVAATISGLTITRGRADQSSPAVPSTGGGVLNQGTLTLANVVVSNNRALGDAGTVLAVGGYTLFGAALGGGVANLGTLAVSGSTFTANQALGGNGTAGLPFPNIVFPGMGLGGGLYNLLSTAAVTNCRFTDNLALGGSNCTGALGALGGGGAVYNDASLSVAGSLFTGNRAVGGDNSVADIHPGHGVGGAIGSGSVQALFGTRSASLQVGASTFLRNEARGGDDNRVTGSVSRLDGPSDAFGGALFVYQGSAAVRASGLIQNRAVGGAGGGDQNGSIGGGGAIIFLNFVGGVTGTVTNNTIVANEALGGAGRAGERGGDALGGGVLMGGLGGVFGSQGSITFNGSILVANLARGGQGGSGAAGGDGLGGGLFNDADSKLALIASLVAANQARGGPGSAASKGIGGGLYNLGTYTSTLSVILGNVASTSNNNVFG